MQLYQGTKQLKAQPMTLGEYNAYRGWTMPENETPDAPGYFVEYTDGGKPNDPRHEGYISWSPADVFEKAYRPCASHVDRIRIEFAELDERIDKLAEFIAGNPTFGTLDEYEQLLMQVQLNSMRTYRLILKTRLDRAA